MDNIDTSQIIKISEICNTDIVGLKSFNLDGITYINESCENE